MCRNRWDRLDALERSLHHSVLLLSIAGTVSAASPWDCPVDMFIYREVDEAVMATEEQVR